MRDHVCVCVCLNEWYIFQSALLTSDTLFFSSSFFSLCVLLSSLPYLQYCLHHVFLNVFHDANLRKTLFCKVHSHLYTVCHSHTHTHTHMHTHTHSLSLSHTHTLTYLVQAW